MVANDCEREICYGVLCGLSLLLVLALSWPCSEGFSPGYSGSPPPPKKLTFVYLFFFFHLLLFIFNNFCPTCINQRCYFYSLTRKL